MADNKPKMHTNQTIDASVVINTLTDVMYKQARDLVTGDLEEWTSVKDLVDATCNNIKHDMGERLGHPGLFFAHQEEEPEIPLVDGLLAGWNSLSTDIKEHIRIDAPVLVNHLEQIEFEMGK